MVDGVSTVFFDYNTPGKGVVGFSSSNNRYSLRSNITGNPFKGLPTSPIKLDGDDAAVANCEEFINQINKEILTAGKVVSLSNSDFLTERLIHWAIK